MPMAGSIGRAPCRIPDSRASTPPLVSTKLMPLAQSSELPPPSATSESIACEAAATRPGLDHAAVGVGVEAVKADDLDAGVRQHPGRALHMSRRHQAGVGDEQGPFEALLDAQVAQPRQ